MEKIVIGCDHAAVQMKNNVINHLKAQGYDVIDVGTYSEESCDYPDYAYAAAVFYSNPNCRNEVINWCQEALKHAELCENTSGKQWVTAMLGSLFKRNGNSISKRPVHIL